MPFNELGFPMSTNTVSSNFCQLHEDETCIYIILLLSSVLKNVYLLRCGVAIIKVGGNQSEPGGSPQPIACWYSLTTVLMATSYKDTVTDA